MRPLLLVPFLAILASCGPKVVLKDRLPYPDAPLIPELPERLMVPCPQLPPIKDNTLAALSAADVKSSLLYKSCKDDKSEIVERYERSRKEQLSYKQQMDLIRQQDAEQDQNTKKK